ncbi:hypothetical protein [Gracilibacillus thailandensis]|uniref:Uncharacterized protein n=1 Tax=Gracilibacillus thailandensis TaxID=563735 RepID=A0A6N7R493_9BACI|nr:hypothetical protein [Gracilibacillus thailandensis]MRI68017.1 hypothetical protein [Gracilibacillus thailandensis]
MKYSITIHLLISASLLLILFAQDLQNWGDFSSIRQWLTGFAIIVWLMHLFTILYLTIRNKKERI